MPMTLSATDLAIAKADNEGTLAFFEDYDRFGDLFVMIKDREGTIEVADSIAEARARVNAIRDRLDA